MCVCKRDVPILASLLLTLGFASCHFVIPMNCCLLNFVSYAPYTDSPSVQGIHFTSCQNMYTVNWKHYGKCESCNWIPVTKKIVLFKNVNIKWTRLDFALKDWIIFGDAFTIVFSINCVHILTWCEMNALYRWAVSIRSVTDKLQLSPCDHANEAYAVKGEE
jgi:hypothetical protein